MRKYSHHFCLFFFLITTSYFANSSTKPLSDEESNMQIQRTNYETLGLPVGPYTHAVTHNGVLYTSGMTAFGTPAQKGNMSEQIQAIFKQLEYICEQQNTSLEKLLKVSIYVSDMSEINSLRETLLSIYGKNIPASSLVKVDALFSEELKVEIEAVFAL